MQFPSSSLRQSGVVVVPQLMQTTPPCSFFFSLLRGVDEPESGATPVVGDEAEDATAGSGVRDVWSAVSGRRGEKPLRSSSTLGRTSPTSMSWSCSVAAGANAGAIRRPLIAAPRRLLYVGQPWHEGVPPVPSHKPPPGHVWGSAGVVGQRVACDEGADSDPSGDADDGRGRPWVRCHRPQRLQTGSPWAERRQSGVVVVAHDTHRMAPNSGWGWSWSWASWLARGACWTGMAPGWQAMGPSPGGRVDVADGGAEEKRRPRPCPSCACTVATAGCAGRKATDRNLITIEHSARWWRHSDATAARRLSSLPATAPVPAASSPLIVRDSPCACSCR